MSNETVAAFILGLSIGVLLAVMNSEFSLLPRQGRFAIRRSVDIIHDSSYMHATTDDDAVQSAHAAAVVAETPTFHRPHHNSMVATRLSSSVRVLCWIMTSPSTLQKRGKPVRDTWGQHCNKVLFMSSVEDKAFPAVGLGVPEGRENLWLKTRAAWKYVFDHHLDDADWFIKADDDSFVVVENLRFFVSTYDTNKPYFFGRHFKTFGGYNSGGAGYVFSKETLRQFNGLLSKPALCPPKAGAEDVAVGSCLQSVGIHPSDSRDKDKRETFHPFGPTMHLIEGAISKDMWLHKYNKYPVVSGPDCCSDYSVSFHYVKPDEMYLMHFLIYRMIPYGVQSTWETLNYNKTTQ